eukprot:comp5686_c0_seq1/m.1564 comp5686_c0_seq1/g.1564  ORF comp5686_c0_seq1/g.1564 comp5686_c0_seq1/m.1564 type:complete len:350 (-) comp5686_c0_seq1:396-1445(-)
MPFKQLTTPFRFLSRAFSHSRSGTRPPASTNLSLCPTHNHNRTHTTAMSRTLTLSDIPTWDEHVFNTCLPRYTTDSSAVNSELNRRISVFVGDITKLEIDAIVNAANRSLLGGGGVDGAIHRAAGVELYKYCKNLNGCNTGESKITPGFHLPAKHVIHTVGPTNGDESALRSCYETALALLLENKLRSIAFCCVSTGIYGFPNAPAADMATDVVKEFLEKHAEEVDRIIFCLFLPVDVKIYENILQDKFPRLAPKETDRKRSSDEVKVGETKEEEDGESKSPKSPKMQKKEEKDREDGEKEVEGEKPKNGEENVVVKKSEEVKESRQEGEAKTEDGDNMDKDEAKEATA